MTDSPPNVLTRIADPETRGVAVPVEAFGGGGDARMQRFPGTEAFRPIITGRDGERDCVRRVPGALGSASARRADIL